MGLLLVGSRHSAGPPLTKVGDLPFLSKPPSSKNLGAEFDQHDTHSADQLCDSAQENVQGRSGGFVQPVRDLHHEVLCWFWTLLLQGDALNTTTVDSCNRRNNCILQLLLPTLSNIT